MSSRLNEVVEALIEGIRGILTEEGVTMDEFDGVHIMDVDIVMEKAVAKAA